MLYGSGTWQSRESDVMKLKRNDVRMVRWICSVRKEKRNSAVECRNKL